jgi:glyoxylase-like metal-dependent hydrolase (beta-lactamase superfamily II)
MDKTSYRFDVGEFHCMVVSDGIIDVTGPGTEPQVMDVACLVIEKGDRKILVDTGCGDKFEASAGKLVQNLRKEGISPADIDAIIYTHGHIDHVGGTFDALGRLMYPRARQVAARKEWDCWANPPAPGKKDDMFALARKTLRPIPEEFDLIEDNAEWIPGIRLIPAAGHTLGSIILEITSGKNKLLCIGDLVHSLVELRKPKYYEFLDSAPAEATWQRTEGLAKIARSGALVFACHFPFPGIGRFVQKSKNLTWEPVKV